MPKVIIYTDGACFMNPGPGGWGAILKYKDHYLEISGKEKNTTNNRMELMAAIKALEILKESCVIDIYTDSQYLQKGMSSWIHKWKEKNWSRGKHPIKNIDLWKKLDSIALKHKIKWKWVKGHSGDELNERADFLANQSISF